MLSRTVTRTAAVSASLAACLALTATSACLERPRSLAPGTLSATLRGSVDIMLAAAQTNAKCRSAAAQQLLWPASSNPRVGATVALAHVGSEDGNTLAYVADQDAAALRVLDVDRGEQVAQVDLAGEPSALMVTSDGRVVVTLRDRNTVAVLAPRVTADVAAGHDLSLLCQRTVAREPVGLAATSGGDVVVTSRWGQRVTVMVGDAGMATTHEHALARDPFGVAVVGKGDAETIFVSHAFGAKVSVVALNNDKMLKDDKVMEQHLTSVQKIERGTKLEPAPDVVVRRRATQAYGLVPREDELWLPLVMADPGEARAIASVAYYGGHNEIPIMAPSLARIGGSGDEVSVDVAAAQLSRDCVLPRAAAFDPTTDTMWVACQGIDRLEARTLEGTRGSSITVAAGVTGLAIEPQRRRLIAWSQFDAEVAVVSLDFDADADAHEGRERVKRIKLPVTKILDPVLALGRRVFHEGGLRRLAYDGRACASCHPGGREDGITWVTPKGPRQTPMLLGRVHDTAPYGWDGSQGDLDSYVRRTIRRLGGNGISGRERAAVIAYMRSLKEPSRVTPPEPSAVEQQGAALFARADTACGNCHRGDSLSDATRHNVGSVALGDQQTEFDTPSLRSLAQTAPYFHDGRYPTLQAMLSDKHLAMGVTKHLSSTELDALAAYLHTL